MDFLQHLTWPVVTLAGFVAAGIILGYTFVSIRQIGGKRVFTLLVSIGLVFGFIAGTGVYIYDTIHPLKTDTIVDDAKP